MAEAQVHKVDIDVDQGSTLYFSCEDISLLSIDKQGEVSRSSHQQEYTEYTDSFNTAIANTEEPPRNEGPQEPVQDSDSTEGIFFSTDIGTPSSFVKGATSTATLSPLPNTEVRSIKYNLTMVIDPKPTVISNRKCSQVRITTFCLVDDTKAWVIDGQDFSEIKLTHIDQELSVKKYYLNTLIHTICLAKDGVSVLVTCPNDHCIRKCQSNGESEILIKTEPLIPQGICLDENSDILVSLTDRKAQDLQQDSQALLRRYKESGELLQEIETHQDKKLFKVPIKVKVNPENGDIAVTNFWENTKGEVIVLDKDGRPKFLYAGQNSNKFCPYDIAFDQLSNILISNIASGTIHLVDSDGKFLGRIYQLHAIQKVLEILKISIPHVFQSDDRFSVPFEMACDSNYNLCVGCADGRVRRIKYCRIKDLAKSK